MKVKFEVEIEDTFSPEEAFNSIDDFEETVMDAIRNIPGVRLSNEKTEEI